MRKIVSFIMLVSMCSMLAMAQRAGELNIWDNKKESWNHSGLLINAGAGIFAGDAVNDYPGIEVNIGYRWHLYEGLCWDVVKAGLTLYCHTEIGDYSELQFMTGLHYDTPRFIAGKSLYIEGSAGAQLCMSQYREFAYEFGLGMKLSRNILLGAVYNSQISGYVRYLGLRFSYVF